MDQPEAAAERMPAMEVKRGLFDRLFRRQPVEPAVERFPTMDTPVHFYTDERIQIAPEQEGVIALWERATLIYLGSAPQSLGVPAANYGTSGWRLLAVGHPLSI
jgi:hypothetical protein